MSTDSDRPIACCARGQTDDAAWETSYRLHRRFDRVGRLFGDDAIASLMDLRVAVIGVGGVGGFAAEALVRSAVGYLAIIDFDDVCVTNTNRQLQALTGNVGKPKVWTLRERLMQINPDLKLDAKRAFYNAQRSDVLLAPAWPGRSQFDFVVDCIDNLTAKAHLIAECRKREVAVVSSMGAAGKLDPTRIRIADLGDTAGCPLARDLRKILRTKHGFAEKGKLGVTAVYSNEKRSWPRELHYDGGRGFRCMCQTKSDEHSCDTRAVIDGTAVYVTGAFGLACASVVVNQVAVPLIEKSSPAVSNKGTAPGQSER